jgi:hypothetical protein
VRDEGCVGYGALRRQGLPPLEILAGGAVAAVRRLSTLDSMGDCSGATWVGFGHC